MKSNQLDHEQWMSQSLEEEKKSELRIWNTIEKNIKAKELERKKRIEKENFWVQIKSERPMEWIAQQAQWDYSDFLNAEAKKQKIRQWILSMNWNVNDLRDWVNDVHEINKWVGNDRIYFESLCIVCHQWKVLDEGLRDGWLSWDNVVPEWMLFSQQTQESQQWWMSVPDEQKVRWIEDQKQKLINNVTWSGNDWELDWKGSRQRLSVSYLMEKVAPDKKWNMQQLWDCLFKISKDCDSVMQHGSRHDFFMEDGVLFHRNPRALMDLEKLIQKDEWRLKKCLEDLLSHESLKNNPWIQERGAWWKFLGMEWNEVKDQKNKKTKSELPKELESKILMSSFETRPIIDRYLSRKAISEMNSMSIEVEKEKQKNIAHGLKVYGLLWTFIQPQMRLEETDACLSFNHDYLKKLLESDWIGVQDVDMQKELKEERENAWGESEKYADRWMDFLNRIDQGFNVNRSQEKKVPFNVEWDRLQCMPWEEEWAALVEQHALDPWSTQTQRVPAQWGLALYANNPPLSHCWESHHSMIFHQKSLEKQAAKLLNNPEWLEDEGIMKWFEFMKQTCQEDLLKKEGQWMKMVVLGARSKARRNDEKWMEKIGQEPRDQNEAFLDWMDKNIDFGSLEDWQNQWLDDITDPQCWEPDGFLGRLQSIREKHILEKQIHLEGAPQESRGLENRKMKKKL